MIKNAGNSMEYSSKFLCNVRTFPGILVYKRTSQAFGKPKQG